ncbi:pyrrolo-quinoline quinone [Adhaeribacter arboris]|uniref:Pyrrolo-quinoline quinone n=1 Tax=Adhaeribacter arboris TaxID=2072846 RepID=A0A2T2YH55_9BACT|nr:PQQ-binding-like beta-propeller repeat protein [Adhaeribacter arboris]PSR54839.1 pyrrolo-quinoline quinone [Adhaeribacter arboris]
MKKFLLPALVLGITGCLTSRMLPENSPATASGRNWREYLGGPDRNHYSTLKQITAENVANLKVAWEYHTLDSGQIQCNPIIVDGVLYGMTATTQPFAVDAATGQERWKLKPNAETNGLSTSRGVTYWESGDDKRILYTNGPWLYALDARTGKAIPSFGENGRTSLKAGLGETAKDKFVISNTPGTVYQDLIIMPMRLSEGADAALGHIQAFDIRTGKLAWVFRTIPQPGEFGYETWPPDTYKNTDVGAGNNWSGMSVDRERGILYVPTGSAAFDFYGGNRKGQNLFANCLLALDAKTGKRLWHFQLVHHDVLDRDPPAPPNLITVKQNGKKIDAVAQVTKQGYIFVFDRVTGQPLFPIEERPVPTTDVAEEQTWPTQPFPTKPAPYARQSLTEADLNPYAENLEELKTTLKASRSEAGPFTPLSKRGTIIFPGLDGGAEWGGTAADPDGILYINSNEMAWLLALKSTAPDASLASLSSGERLYATNCTACHGTERKGNPASGYPALVDIQKHRTTDYVTTVVSKGKGMMPAFTKFSAEEKKALVSFLFGTEKIEPGITKLKEPGLENKKGMPDVPYRISGYTKFLDKKGYPAISPPWGTLNAIDMNTGEYLWKIPYGETPELAAKGLPQTGSESYGGPVVTASGLLFIAGTKDKKFRAYDKKNGKLLWETTLPAAAFATPSTYEVNGKQYIVLACGGTKLGAPKGDSYVAFALPDK